MKIRTSLIGCLFLFNIINTEAKNATTFIGAVVEYGPIWEGKTLQQIVLNNVQGYAEIIETIKSSSSFEKLDIIVFPEDGLGALANNTKIPYSETVPDPTANIVPCGQTNTPVVSQLSCLAKNQIVYLVVNLVEAGDINATVKYNTNVVFDRNGTVIARYRKVNLFGETYISKPANNNTMSYFFTDFGVWFGTFTCFDIYFKTPALDLVDNNKATHFVYPAAWMSELPFLTAIQEQASWSYMTNRYLLAANRNDPSIGMTGSGIYMGRNSGGETRMSQVKGNFAIISSIPFTIGSADSTEDSETIYFYNTSNVNISPLELKRETDLQCMTSEVVPQGTEFHPYEDNNGTLASDVSLTKEISFEKWKCEFKIKLTTVHLADVLYIDDPKFSQRGDLFGRFRYRLVSYNGVRGHNNTDAKTGTQICAIVSCLDDKGIDTCAIKTNDGSVIESTHFAHTYYQVATIFTSVDISLITLENITAYPNVLLQAITPDHTTFGAVPNASTYVFSTSTDTDNRTTARFLVKLNEKIVNPGAIGIYGRVFQNDGKGVTTCSASGLSSTTAILLMLSSVIACFSNSFLSN